MRNSITLRSVWCAKHSDCQLTEAETTSYYPTTTTTKQSKANKQPTTIIIIITTHNPTPSKTLGKRERRRKRAKERERVTQFIRKQAKHA